MWDRPLHREARPEPGKLMRFRDKRVTDMNKKKTPGKPQGQEKRQGEMRSPTGGRMWYSDNWESISVGQNPSPESEKDEREKRTNGEHAQSQLLDGLNLEHTVGTHIFY